MVPNYVGGIPRAEGRVLHKGRPSASAILSACLASGRPGARGRLFSHPRVCFSASPDVGGSPTPSPSTGQPGRIYDPPHTTSTLKHEHTRPALCNTGPSHMKVVNQHTRDRGSPVGGGASPVRTTSASQISPARSFKPPQGHRQGTGGPNLPDLRTATRGPPHGGTARSPRPSNRQAKIDAPQQPATPLRAR